MTTYDAPATQATWTDGQKVNAAALNTQLRDPMNWLRNVPQTLIYRNAAASLNSVATYSVVTWDTAYYDTNTGWAPVSPTRVWVQAPGRYMVVGRYCFSSSGASGTGARAGMMRMNSGGVSTLGTLIDSDVAPIVSGSSTTWRSVMYVQCVSQDYFEMFVYQTSGGALPFVTGMLCNLTIKWVGR